MLCAKQYPKGRHNTYASQLSHLRLRHLPVRPVRSDFMQYNNTPNRPNFCELLQYNYTLVTFFRDCLQTCLVWSCEASGKAQTSIESPPEICCFADACFDVFQFFPSAIVNFNLIMKVTNFIGPHDKQGLCQLGQQSALPDYYY
jgi:hypothetical protein